MTQIDKQTLRDIFNSNGLNYSQIVGDELTTVSMELQDFNYSLEQVLALIANQVREARIEELQYIREFWGQAKDDTLSSKPFNFVALSDIDNRIAQLRSTK